MQSPWSLISCLKRPNLPPLLLCAMILTCNCQLLHWYQRCPEQFTIYTLTFDAVEDRTSWHKLFVTSHFLAHAI